MSRAPLCLSVIALTLTAVSAQTTKNPFPEPINATSDIILVKSVDFAQIPFVGKEAPRLMLLLNEPGTHRLFVNTMRGVIYSVSYDGRTVKEYIDINSPHWGIDVHFSSHDSGFQSFAFHPEFNRPGKPGYGKFYTYTDTSNMAPQADFLPNGKGHAHDTVLLEWTAKNPAAQTYDGAPPRELFRTAKPFPIHNGGQLAFNPLAKPGSEDYGLLYAGVADGGSGGDPYHHAQNLSVAFGKILRIDPLGHNSRNGNYGIPANNPFVKNPRAGAMGEIYAYGCRNPQRFSWDPKNGHMFLADIGQDVVEKITLVTPGANLGWNVWEGSFRYAGHQVETAGRAADPAVTFPILEFDHTDPLLKSAVAVTGVYAYRSKAIPALTGKLIFGDNPSSELFYVSADHLPSGGQDAIRRILIKDGAATTTLLKLIQKKNAQQGLPVATRTDMRINLGAHGEIFLTNKMDGYIRRLVR
jgi:hypothetical protein